MADRIVTPYEGGGAVAWDGRGTVEAPLRLHRATVKPEWVDYNGHMSESCFLLVFGDSADAFFRFLGIDEAYRETGRSLYTAETHLHHRHEAGEGDPLALSLQLLDHDRRRVHVFHQMTHAASGVLLAAAEQLLVHVDTSTARSADIPPALTDRLDSIRRAHEALPVSDLVGRPMGIRRPR